MSNQQGKTTKGDLERRMRNAIVLVPKDKYYKGVFFDDKRLRLEVTQDFAVVSTGYHRHVFNNITAFGASRPYLYVSHFIDIALANDCTIKDANGKPTRSYAKLMAVLKEKEDKKEYNMCWYVDLWLNNIFHPLFGIGEKSSESFLVLESYMHNLARNKVIYSEKADGMTNKQFVAQVIKELQGFVEGMDEGVIFEPKSDEQRMQEEIDAAHQELLEKSIAEGVSDAEQ